MKLDCHNWMDLLSSSDPQLLEAGDTAGTRGGSVQRHHHRDSSLPAMDLLDDGSFGADNISMDYCFVQDVEDWMVDEDNTINDSLLELDGSLEEDHAPTVEEDGVFVTTHHTSETEPSAETITTVVPTPHVQGPTQAPPSSPGYYCLELARRIDRQMQDDRVKDAARQFEATAFRGFQAHFRVAGETADDVAKELLDRGLV